jgi:hypothetical protein
MVLQAFVDESFDGEMFVLAGYISPAERWLRFSEEWEKLLPLAVLNERGTYQFKMAEMASNPERLSRVAAFYRVIEAHAQTAISIQLRLADIDGAMRRMVVPGTKLNWKGWRNPYLFAFRMLTDVINMRRQEMGQVMNVEEKIDFIFDERSEKVRVMQAWETVRNALPQRTARLYGATPRFEDDEDFLPLQAADFWAWWVRKWALEDVPFGEGSYPWSSNPEKPPKLFVSANEDDLIIYLSSIVAPHLPPGKSIFILPE